MGLFSAPPAPSVPDAPPPPPQIDASKTEADERLRLARRKGREATLKAGSAASPLTGQTRQATLVGQSLTGS